jgi:glutamate N-acetyltransferase/amino-acid N-acetyltransferase
MVITEMNGGVTAAKGFKANGVLAGIKKGRTKPDLALIYSEVPCTAAAIYTTNLVKGAPITVTQKNLENGIAQAVICNSGNANTCNADGIEKAERMCAIAAEQLGISANDIIVGSTGVIGQVIPMEPIEAAAKKLADGLTEDGSPRAAEAIMTTDTYKKEVAAQVEIGGKAVTIGGISKGSGMIHPNMATMLCFVTTDCKISADMLRCAIKESGDKTFNMISVDGDTSTNDTLSVMANGLAENPIIAEKNEDYYIFLEALEFVCRKLAKLMAADGEGCTKLLVCKVTGAKDWETAKTVSKSVICSSLLKAAMFGADANWGRVLCAIGYSGADVDVNKIDVSFSGCAGQVDVCVNGAGIDFSEEAAKKVLTEKEINILVDLKLGSAEAEAYGCDLTYDYVKINGDYRT